MKTKKYHLPSPDLLYIVVGIITVVIVAIPVAQWVLTALVADVGILLYAIFRSRHKL